MADLSVKQLNMANPFIIASSPATQGVKAVLKSAESLPGAIVMRNFGHAAGGGNYIYPSAADMLAGRPAFESHALGARVKDPCSSFEAYCEAVRHVRSTLSQEIRLWVSIGHFFDLAGMADWNTKWIREAREFERAGADAVELHFNTPGVAAIKDRVYDFPRLILNTVRLIKDAVKIPVMVKLPLEMTDPLRAMDAAVYGGADAVGPTARWKALTFELDYKRTLARGGGGYSGTQALPIICYTVAEAKSNGISVPIYAGGGVFSAEGAMKLIMAGSHAVQLGSFACTFGPGPVAGLIKRFNGLMDEYGYQDIDSLRGVAARLIDMPAKEADARNAAVGECYRQAQVDTKKCIGCGRCVDACWHGGIEMTAVKKAAKTDACIGCGYCFAVCPNGSLSCAAADVAQAYMSEYKNEE